MRKKDSFSTRFFEICSTEMIDYTIKFETEIASIFDLSYFLIDFQAVVNGLSELISFNEVQDGEFQLSKIFDKEKIEKALVEAVESKTLNESENTGEKNELVQTSEETIMPYLERKRESFKQTTNRWFNKKYRENWQLKNFSKGSLFLDIRSAVIGFFVTEFLGALLGKRFGNSNITNIKIQNSIVIINGEDVRVLPANSHILNSIVIRDGRDKYDFDIKNYIDTIINEVEPDCNVEESVKRFLNVLKKEGIIREQVMYDARGIKTLVKDYERMVGSFFDARV